ncbi:MAG: high-potential iron-sulfur protein [Rudaea sp.]
MNNKHDSNSIDDGRRRFFVGAGGALGAAVLASTLPRTALADDLPHLALSDPTAIALNYTEDASKVDKAKAPTFVAGSVCANCNFFQGAAAAFGPCALFPGKAVNAKGWCAGYAKKA